MADALYTRLDDEWWQPTELTRGGWDDRAQHGGPPCGLLGTAIAAVPTAVPMQVTRLTFDLYRPVPVDEPLRVTTEVLRAGRRIQVVTARLATPDVDLALATGLLIRVADPVEFEAYPGPEWTPPTLPAELESIPRDAGLLGRGRELLRFHRDAVEIRSAAGSFAEPGPATSWFRLKVPLFADDPLDGFQRLATLADMANGNGRVLDPRRWLFVNPDLSLTILRYPRGEWVGMDSRSYPAEHGIGMADTLVFDEDGPIGRIAQSQIVERHA